MTAKTEFLLARQALCDAAVARFEITTPSPILSAHFDLLDAATRYAIAAKATGLGSPALILMDPRD